MHGGRIWVESNQGDLRGILRDFLSASSVTWLR
jgi:hypothetical protein